MTNKRSTKGTLLSSIIAMILCFTMFVGATLAWFTSTVSNKGNRIEAGTLKVDLLMDKEENGNYVSIADGMGDIFSEATGNGTFWEPGKTEIVYLKVENQGSLALKYNIVLTIDDEELAGSLEYAILDGMTAAVAKGNGIDSGFDSWKEIKQYADVQIGAFPTGEVVAAPNGKILAGSADGVYNGDCFALAVHMKEDAGNEYQGKALSFDVKVLATQVPEEEDSFGTDYDEQAVFEGEGLVLGEDDAWVNILVNGDFEKGKSAWNQGNSGTIVTENDNSYLQLADKDWSYKNVIQMLTGLNEGQKFVIKGQRRQAAKVNSCQLVITPAKGSQTGTSEIISMNTVTTGWEDFEVEYTLPEGWNGLWIQMRVRGGNINDVVEWDNMQVLTEQTQVTRFANAFRAMLAEEQENSQQVTKKFADDVTTTFPGQPANIVPNGDLESTEISWTLGSVGSIVEGEGTNNSKALQISGANAAYVRQSVPIVGGAEYYVTYKYKVAADQTQANPTLKVGFFSSITLDGASCLSEKYLGMQTSSEGCIRNGEWQTRTRKIYPPANATVLAIEPMMLQSAEQTVMFDDITITMTQAPFALSLVTDQVFYYTDAKSGVFTASVNTNYYPNLADAKVDFQVYDGNSLLWENTVSANEGVASTEFSFVHLMKMEHPYCVKATIYNLDGTVADASTQNIYIYERPEYVNEDGIFQKEGEEPFYPIMSYHVWYKDKENNHYAESAAAGITLVEIYGTTAKDQLDVLEQYGMKGVIALHANMKPAGADVNIEYTTGVLSNPEVTNHPALFGYIVMDEVYLGLTDPERDMENSYRLIRMLDPKHPVITMEALPGYYDECGKYVDILFIDPYGTAESQYAYNATKEALESVNYAKGVYTNLCTYGTESNWHRAEDIRNNCYQALIAGADAVGYYAISDGVTKADGKTTNLWSCEFDENPDYTVWDKVVEFGTKERNLAFDHFVYEKTPAFNQELGENYWYSSWVADGAVYMIVLGMKDNQSLEVQIPLTSTVGEITIGEYTAEIVAGGSGTLEGNGTLNVIISDTDAILYKIMPANEVDYSALK